MLYPPILFFFFFNDTATTEIYTLSLHDALPICAQERLRPGLGARPADAHIGSHDRRHPSHLPDGDCRSEEHTSELQSQSNLVCRLLLEKKKKTQSAPTLPTAHAQTQRPLSSHYA